MLGVILSGDLVWITKGKLLLVPQLAHCVQLCHCMEGFEAILHLVIICMGQGVHKVFFCTPFKQVY